MKIEVLSAIEQIRTRPSMYFDNGVPTNAQLLSAVLMDLAEHKGFRAEVIRDGDFCLVGADVDWLITDRAPFEALFSRFVIPNARGPNTFRAEVLLAAVCEGILTLGHGENYSQRLSVSELPSSISAAAKGKVRTLIWKFLA